MFFFLLLASSFGCTFVHDGAPINTGDDYVGPSDPYYPEDTGWPVWDTGYW